jgi:hypothetical protein
LFTGSYAISASYAVSSSYLLYTHTASFAETGSLGPAGNRGSPEVCLITYEQYLKLIEDSTLKEVCTFSS